MSELAGKPYWELTFDKSGTLTAPAAPQLLAEIATSGVTELFVLSHGWGNSEQSARDLYGAMFPMIATAAKDAAGLGPIGFAGVIWPSLWFPDPPADAAPAVAAAVAAGRPGAADAAVTGGQIAQALQPSFTDPGQQADLATMGRLVDEGTAAAAAGTEPPAAQQARLEEFHGLLQNLTPTGPQPVEDSGESALVTTDDPQRDFAFIADTLGSAPEGGAAEGLGDIFGKVWNGAKSTLRAASYWEMKARAGDVGSHGVGPLLEQLHAQAPKVRVHLIGHSFGARLVSFALAGISSAAASPVASLYLIQGAFSHWSFAHVQDMPFGQAGALNQYADRVHGPLVATFSEHDWAVGRWYPKASFLAQQMASAETEPNAQWGGMGSDGFQGVAPTDDQTVLAAGKRYGLQHGAFYRVDCGTVVANTSQSSFSGAHSDIRHPEIAWLAAAAASGG